jgi:hypothetical protein
VNYLATLREGKEKPYNPTYFPSLSVDNTIWVVMLIQGQI